ncbi:DUF6427 family protein [Chitinophaga sedimenti]|uniref:DUF6427 family protein n=1 Tax=Chitinophaga sedimenti TaxID=2033606 RepID=UPI002004868B|nr:DUF6427 family protein [Chitinophaga sedimenti]MCK7559244.1 DUF6427 family protein [Chitinophaga sedimenti]
MIKFFRSGNPLTVLLLLVYTIFIKFYYILHPQTYMADGSEGILYRLITGWFDRLVAGNAVFYTMLAILLLFLQALLLNRIVNYHRLFSKPNHLPAMCYILFTSLYQGWNVFSAALLVNTIMLWIISSITELYNRSSARDVSFNIGFALGIAGLIYPPAVLCCALLYAGLLTMRAFRLAEWIIALLGLICPAYLLGTYLFLADKNVWEVLPRLGLEMPVINDYKVWGALIASVLFFALGWLLLQRTFKKMLIQGRKIWAVLAIYVIIAMLVPFFSLHFSPANWVLALLPLSMFAGNVFWSINHNGLANTGHFIVLAYAIVMQYFSH